MHQGNGKPAGEEAPRIRWPLFWSTAAHLLAILSLVALGGGGTASPLRGIVDVILVEAAGEGRAAAQRTVPAPSNRGSRGRAVPRRVPEGPPAESPAPSRVPIRPTGEALLPAAGEAASKVVVPDAPAGPAWETFSGEKPDPAGPLPASDGREREVSPDDPSAPAASAPDPGLAAGNSPDGAGAALLRARIQSRIVYPEEAVRRGQEGEVILRVRIGPGGFPREIRIARSSGARLLDEAASRGVVRAAPLPSDPGWVEVPVRFRLR